MKTYVIALLVLGLTTISYQDKMGTDSKTEIMNTKVTSCCHQKCWRRLSVYLPDRNADPKVRKLKIVSLRMT
jgi:hypothetical protein